MAKTHLNIGAPVADLIGLPLDVDRGAMFAAGIGVKRNGRFPRLAKLWLKGRECAYCFAKAEEAHHIFPFWLFPSLELDDRYWLPVCRSGADHHLYGAHLGSFDRFDVLAREHASIFKACARFSAAFARLVRLAEARPELADGIQDVLRELTGAKRKGRA